MAADELNKEDIDKAQRIVDEAEGELRKIENWTKWIIPAVAALWSLFQLSLATFLLLNSTIVRSIHFAFAIFLVYLSHPFFKKPKKNKILNYFASRKRISVFDFTIAITAAAAALYIAFDYIGISTRQGSPLTRDIIVGFVLIVLLLEAARRSLGPALSVIAAVFILYAFFGPYMPAVIAF